MNIGRNNLSALSNWKVGTSLTCRSVGKRVFSAYPAVVVQDTPDLIALYLPAGTIGKTTDKRITPQDMIAPEGITLVNHVWVRTDVLFLAGPEDAFCTYLMWKSGTRELICWYINLQEPTRRTSIGIDTLDNILDIVISPDMTEWRWKDTDEFEEAQKVGLYSRERAREIWAEGEKAVRLLTSERRSFYEGWKEWQADPEWEIPKLSPLWDRVDLDVVSSQNNG
jgi:hypothetical protein